MSTLATLSLLLTVGAICLLAGRERFAPSEMVQPPLLFELAVGKSGLLLPGRIGHKGFSREGMEGVCIKGG